MMLNLQDSSNKDQIDIFNGNMSNIKLRLDFAIEKVVLKLKVSAQ